MTWQNKSIFTTRQYQLKQQKAYERRFVQQQSSNLLLEIQSILKDLFPWLSLCQVKLTCQQTRSHLKCVTIKAKASVVLRDERRQDAAFQKEDYVEKAPSILTAYDSNFEIQHWEIITRNQPWAAPPQYPWSVTLGWHNKGRNYPPTLLYADSIYCFTSSNCFSVDMVNSASPVPKCPIPDTSL